MSIRYPHESSDAQRHARHWRSVVRDALIVIAMVALVAGTTSGSWVSGIPVFQQRPRLMFDDSVADDFQALAVETWDRFLTVFQARSDCFGDVHLRAARVLNSRAAYDPDSSTVVVRVPGTPAMLQSALIHEWAHHIEFQCKAHEDLRPVFLAAQGLPPDTVWRPDNLPAEMSTSEWADIPSEQYAEATVALVLGDRPIPTKARFTKEAVRVIAEWAAGD